ncbi:hypothetical protein [Terribacillus saccharophilus]|uniref:hypothetical protein n=1 Tax=Terribacillus saccharophilus TaxID=361277 RepID=UPI0039823861
MDFQNLTQQHLKELIDEFESLNFNISSVNSAKLIIHEASHYLDNLVTLSGQEMLVKTYNAFNEYEQFNQALNNNAAKPTVQNIIDFLNAYNNWTNRSFTTLLSNDSYKPGFKNWSFNYSTDRSLDIYNQPNGPEIMLFTFKHQDRPFAKIPFSIEALWETNAMWAEITYHFEVARQLERDGMIVEGNDMQKKYEEYLYNPNLFVYSIAAHLTSSLINIGDILNAFKLSKALSSISLNLPFRYYSQLRKTNGKVFKGLVNKLLNNTTNLNPCTIYLVLLENVVESGINLNDLISNDGIDLNQILFINNLPDKSLLKEEILSNMYRLNLQVDGPHTELYKFHKDTGINLFTVHGIEGGLNVHPGFLIDLANKSQACIFQGWDEEALLADESEALKRRDYFQILFKKIIT